MPNTVSEQLAEYNKWRRGKGRKYQQAGSMQMTPEELGIAIDKAVKLCHAAECLRFEDVLLIEELAKAGEAAVSRFHTVGDNVARIEAIHALARFRKAFAKATK